MIAEANSAVLDAFFGLNSGTDLISEKKISAVLIDENGNFFFHFLKIKFRCTVSFLSTWVVMTMTVKFRFANIRRGK